MRKRAVIALLAVLAALGLAISTAGSAQAISRETIDLSYVLAHAHTNNGGDTYFGDLKSETSGQCLKMERKTSGGDWVDTGFWNGQFNLVIEHCADELADHANWQIHGGASVYGIRVHGVGGGNTTINTFCDTKANCQAL